MNPILVTLVLALNQAPDLPQAPPMPMTKVSCGCTDGLPCRCEPGKCDCASRVQAAAKAAQPAAAPQSVDTPVQMVPVRRLAPVRRSVRSGGG